MNIITEFDKVVQEKEELAKELIDTDIEETITDTKPTKEEIN